MFNAIMDLFVMHHEPKNQVGLLKLLKIFNLKHGREQSSRLSSVSFVLSLCLTLSKDGYDDAAAHEHG